MWVVVVGGGGDMANPPTYGNSGSTQYATCLKSGRMNLRSPSSVTVNISTVCVWGSPSRVISKMSSKTLYKPRFIPSVLFFYIFSISRDRFHRRMGPTNTITSHNSKVCPLAYSGARRCLPFDFPCRQEQNSINAISISWPKA